jgi:hypothetical protein
MPQANDDAEIRALQALIDALQPLDDDARSRVLEYTLKRLGMRELTTGSSLMPPLREEVRAKPSDTPVRQTVPTDIRSLREAKKPSSAIEMAAIVAYYLAEVAPKGERKDTVTTADIEKYFKQAQYRLPSAIEKALGNAAAAGYFDRADRGQYRLNPVGYNLVTQSLPRGSGDAAPRQTPARKKTTARTQRTTTSATKRKK